MKSRYKMKVGMMALGNGLSFGACVDSTIHMFTAAGCRIRHEE
jgi:hypothetical protein